MIRGYPIGYCILWEAPDDQDDKKSSIGLNDKNYVAPKELVIDGQQRLAGPYASLRDCRANFACLDYQTNIRIGVAEFASHLSSGRYINVLDTTRHSSPFSSMASVATALLGSLLDQNHAPTSHGIHARDGRPYGNWSALLVGYGSML